MTTTPKRARTSERSLKVGDRVSFSFGQRQFTGTIIEDRGPIAAGGRRLYVVRAQIDLSSESVFELPADELRAAAA